MISLVPQENKKMYMDIIVYYSDGEPKIEAHYGQGSGSIFNDLACDGDESNIEECDHAGWGNEDCNHSDDAGVECCKYIKSTSSNLKPSLMGLHFSQNTFKINFMCHIPGNPLGMYWKRIKPS